VFCPRFAHPKTASTIIDSAIEDAKEAAANLVFDSIQTTGTASSNSIVHTPIPSFTNDNKRPKRKTPSKSLSSSTSLGSEMNGEETQKKKKRSLFNRKLRITLKTSKPKSPTTKDSNNNNNKENANNDNKHCYIQKSCKNNDNPQLTIQHLLSLRTKRSLQAQSNLSLLQLKQQARQKARANKPDKTQKKPKRKKRSKKKQKQKLPASNENEMLEPVTKTEMNTGTLLLFRGENPRAKFVWRK